MMSDHTLLHKQTGLASNVLQLLHWGRHLPVVQALHGHIQLLGTVQQHVLRCMSTADQHTAYQLLRNHLLVVLP